MQLNTVRCYFALLRLGFPTAPALPRLNLAASRNSQAHSTKGTPSPASLRAPTCCGFTVSGSISLPSPGFFSPFPHGTSALSVVSRIQPWIVVDPASGRVSRAPPYSGFRCLKTTLRLRGFHPLRQAFPKPFCSGGFKVLAVLQPRPCGRFGLLRFRSPLLPESLLISFPGVLRWFSSPGSASITYLFNNGYPVLTGWVTPFGYQRINGYLLLPVAFRSLSRPSSPRYAKASAVNPSFS